MVEGSRGNMKMGRRKEGDKEEEGEEERRGRKGGRMRELKKDEC